MKPNPHLCGWVKHNYLCGLCETRNKLTLCDNSNVIILGGAKLKSPETPIPLPPMTFTAMRRVHLGWFYHWRMHCHLIPVFPAQIYPRIVPIAVGPFQYLYVLSCLLLCGSCEQNKTPKLNSWTTTLKSKQTLESIFIKALKVFDKFRNFSFHYISLNSIAISSCSRTNFV